MPSDVLNQPMHTQAQIPASEPSRILLIDDSPEELSLLIKMMSHRKIRFKL